MKKNRHYNITSLNLYILLADYLEPTMDQCPAPRLLGPMGSISINDETSAVAGLGGTGLAASAHRTRLAARIATRTATTRNKSRRRRASMASQEEGRNAPLELDGWMDLL